MKTESKTAIQELLQSGETLGTVVNVIIVSNYGEEAYDWDPLTIAMELQADFEVDPSPEVMDRWCAMQILMGSDAFFKRIDAFLGVCNTLSSGEPFFSAFDPVTAEEAAWAIAEASMNRDMLDFSPTVRSYIKKRLDYEGFEGKIPDIFEDSLKNTPKSAEIREGLVSLDRKDAIEAVLGEKIGVMISQLGKIPDLKGVGTELITNGIHRILKV